MMKDVGSLVLILFSAVKLSGCGTNPVESEHLGLADIFVGMKQQEVRSILGEPFETAFFPELTHFCDTFQYTTPLGPRFSHVRYDVNKTISVVTNRNHVCALTDADGEVHRI
ncbi:hypothetical protein QTA57_13450 [Fontisubflavum oceani]|uniref:hypothetical protein n=1 Tax=Fontisubflavum oceani TaxID=2978973 RepID=UPI0025B452F3|nr:hypothetical protein [Fontisubflavum oceani]WJY20810.1 hypothetical protein QTA57_13450 [Fontisubflavum oceani]